MAGWSGFSDAEIRRMREDITTKKQSDDLTNARLSAPSPRVQAKPSTLGASKQKRPQKHSKSVNNEKEESPSAESDQHNVDNTDPENSARIENESEIESEGCSSKDVEVKELDDKEVLSMELRSIETYQKQQKEMEELNKKKKALLLNAIEERRRQAKKESSKLAGIQKEFSHLDSLLCTDVSILRDRIEVASRDFTEAQKRYEIAEKEFVSAKMDLHHKSDVKEGLTEHLYVIIHQNELRRSKKLGELMNKLDMDSSGSDDSVYDVTIVTSPHTIMTSVQTLGPSGPSNPNKILIDSLKLEKTDEIEKSETKPENEQNTVPKAQENFSGSPDLLTDLNDNTNKNPSDDVIEDSAVKSTERENSPGCSSLRNSPNFSPGLKKVRFADGEISDESNPVLDLHS